MAFKKITFMILVLTVPTLLAMPYELNDYPYDEIEEYLLTSGLSTEGLPDLEPSSPTDCNMLRTEDKCKNCCTETEILRPTKLIRDEDNSVKYVIQTENFKQQIKSVKCPVDITGSPCFTDLQIDNYTTKCTSEKVHTKLLAYDKETKTVDWYDYWVDTACFCSIENQ